MGSTNDYARRMILVALLIFVAGCNSITAPTVSPKGNDPMTGRRPGPGDGSVAPRFGRIEARAKHGKLTIEVDLHRRSPVGFQPYDWFMIAWLDTDQNPATGVRNWGNGGWDFFTGYGQTDGLDSVFTTQPEPYGIPTSALRFDPRTRKFTVTIPLSTVGGDDGRLDGVFTVSSADGSTFDVYPFTARRWHWGDEPVALDIE